MSRSSNRSALLLGLLVVLGWAMAAATVRATTIDFSDLTFGGSAVTGTSGSYFDGGGVSFPWVSGGVTFNNAYVDFGGGSGSWYGWAYSNVNDTSDGSFQNMYAAWPGPTYGTYAVAFDDGYSAATNVAFFDLPAGFRAQSVELANTTYAALTMKNGDGYGFCKAFQSGDFFTVTFTGWSGSGGSGSPTGSATFQLATDDQIVTGWGLLDLGSLADGTQSISVSFRDSQSGFVPAYVALDNLTLVAVPEPAAAVLAVTGLTAWLLRRRVRLA